MDDSCYVKYMTWDYKKWYAENRDEQRRKANGRVKVYRKRNQDFILRYLSTHPCVDCGETNVVALQCDHIKGKKRNNIGNMITQGQSLELLKEELKKCEVICANCHMIRTQKEKDSYRVQYEEGRYEFTT